MNLGYRLIERRAADADPDSVTTHNSRKRTNVAGEQGDDHGHLGSDERGARAAINTGPKLVRRPLDPDDAELVSIAQEQGTHAVAHIAYERFAPSVHCVLQRVLGPDSDHEDLVNETFVEVIKSLAAVRQPERLRSWVASVAINVARRELGRRQLRRRLRDAVSVTGQVSEPPTDHAGRDLLAKTYEILEAISPDERTVFALRYIDRSTMPVVAELCGCSLSTAKRRLARAERRFAALARQYPEIFARFERRISDQTRSQTTENELLSSAQLTSNQGEHPSD